jgi:hypothetical protein
LNKKSLEDTELKLVHEIRDEHAKWVEIELGKALGEGVLHLNESGCS